MSTLYGREGGRKTLMSERVMSSGNMPPVCSNMLRRSDASEMLKRLATPGRCQTCSIAAWRAPHGGVQRWGGTAI